jgi:hypothetical protein
MTTSGLEMQLVIARYREDLSWLREIGLPCVVYNKGPELAPSTLPPGAEVVNLPNVGREAHTYLTHILAHYHELPRHTALLQGNPFTHLAPPPSNEEDIQETPQGLRKRLLELAHKDTPFAGLAWFRLRCDGLGRPHDLADPAKQGRWKGWGKDIPVARTFAALFQAPAPQEFIARGVTGNMLVRADRILARPEAFYRRALELVAADPDDADNTGHALERLWQLVFSGAGSTAAAAASRPGDI